MAHSLMDDGCDYQKSFMGKEPPEPAENTIHFFLIRKLCSHPV